MSDNDKTTDDSKTELTDEQLDGAQGGAAYLKLGDIDGESRVIPQRKANWKIEEGDALVDKSSPDLLKK